MTNLKNSRGMPMLKPTDIAANHQLLLRPFQKFKRSGRREHCKPYYEKLSVAVSLLHDLAGPCFLADAVIPFRAAAPWCGRIDAFPTTAAGPAGRGRATRTAYPPWLVRAPFGGRRRVGGAE
eukprot:3729528-Pyramimonas_sp.AAC.1